MIPSTNYSKDIASGVCVVDVSAPWCPDCRKIEPMMKALEEEYKQVKFLLVDFDSNEELRSDLGIRRIPTLIFYKDGVEVGERLIEPSNKLDIENALKTAL